MDEINVRPADLEDLPTLLRFEQGVIEAERPFDVTLADDIRYYDMEAMLTTPNIRLVVAELDGEVIASGYARIEEAKPYLKHDRHSYMGFMYTVPEHRGKGVNWKIIEALEEWSRSQGVTEMRLEVYIDNLAAVRSYEKVGFAGYVLKMRKGLE
jgi:GNAT superfamily N-acetyltransferase